MGPECESPTSGTRVCSHLLVPSPSRETHPPAHGGGGPGSHFFTWWQ